MTKEISIRLPANNWRPRHYQRKFWNYFQNGGKRACLVWHRRAGKDENCLHLAATAAQQEIGNYWHMLPEANQARKAIWEAVNPHTGRRRIDEAFPEELRETTREQEMMIRFNNGSTWQVVGSDNFNSLVGSAPRGIVFSEWSLANPASWAYLRPILAENGGWAVFIYTPRGKNHGYSTYKMASESADWFCQRITADDTGVLSQEVLQQELAELQAQYGTDYGRALWEQEYFCSFDAAILGSIYGEWMSEAERDGRIGDVPYDPNLPCYTSWDLGRTNSTAIWWFQVVYGEVRWIDFHASSGKDPKYYADLVKSKPYKYTAHYLPHDSVNKLLAAGGRSMYEQLTLDHGLKPAVIIPATEEIQQHSAARLTIKQSWFDAKKCELGIEALKQFHFEWDEETKSFGDKPFKDWCSDPADAFEIGACAWKTPPVPAAHTEPRWVPTFNELVARNRQERLEREG